MRRGRLAEQRRQADPAGARDRDVEHSVEEAKTAPLVRDHGNTRLSGLTRRRAQQRVMADDLVADARNGAGDVATAHGLFDPDGSVELAVDVAEAVAAVQELRDRNGVVGRGITDHDVVDGAGTHALLVGGAINHGRDSDAVLHGDTQDEALAQVRQVDQARIRINRGSHFETLRQRTVRATRHAEGATPVVDDNLHSGRVELETQLDVALAPPLVRLLDAEGDQTTHGLLNTRHIVSSDAGLMREARSNGVGEHERARRGGKGERGASEHAGTLAFRAHALDTMGPGPPCHEASRIMKRPLARPVAASA